MAIPQDFSNYLKKLDVPWLASLARAMECEPEISVRLNRAKPADSFPAGLQRVPWCPDGLYLPERPAFTFDPRLHQGSYYVQDASSMFISHAIRSIVSSAAGPVKVLDACAAPGGKTTAITDALPYGSLVVANEFVPERATVLRENLAKWGYPFTTVTQGDTALFRNFPAFFDIVAADVPCSGEGMMRKDAVAASQWSPSLVRQCAERQREIIANLWPSLRPGGYFIYSTCTFNREENEDMVAHMIETFKAESIALPVPQEWGIAPSLNPGIAAYRFIPGLIRGEGLFMAVLRKPLADQPPEIRSTPKKERRRSAAKSSAPKLPDYIKDWLTTCGNFEFDSAPDGRVFASFTDYPVFTPTLEIGEIKGRDIIPSQQLAMNRTLNMNVFPNIEVSEETAIDYLRREAITLPYGSPRGITLLTFAGRPLGFAKNLGNRANNLYPKHWRILSRRP